MTHPLLSIVLAATKAPAKSSSSVGTIIYFAVLIAIGYFVWRSFGRNRRMQAQRRQHLTTELHPGQEVLTTSGIIGTVLDSLGDRITIETAPGTRMTLLRSAIARPIEPEPPVEEPDEDDDTDLHQFDDLHDLHDLDGLDGLDEPPRANGTDGEVAADEPDQPSPPADEETGGAEGGGRR